MTGFRLVLADPDETYGSPYTPSNDRMHCEGCGRFVKPGRCEPYYNGTFNCARTHYVCSLCGPMRMEHV